MWDGSIQEQPWLYDSYFGRGHRDSEIRKMDEAIRKKGGILPAE